MTNSRIAANGLPKILDWTGTGSTYVAVGLAGTYTMIGSRQTFASGDVMVALYLDGEKISGWHIGFDEAAERANDEEVSFAHECQPCDEGYYNR
jgi:hypothetical protein